MAFIPLCSRGSLRVGQSKEKLQKFGIRIFCFEGFGTQRKGRCPDEKRYFPVFGEEFFLFPDKLSEAFRHICIGFYVLIEKKEQLIVAAVANGIADRRT